MGKTYNVWTMIKGLWTKSSATKDWTCDYDCQFNSPDAFANSYFSACTKGNSSWDKYMTGNFPEIVTENGESFARFKCLKGTGSRSAPVESDLPWLTTGITTKGNKYFESGKIEVKAKFRTNAYTWPAIWLRNNSYHGNADYYEIDMSEVFGNSLTTECTFYNPYIMRVLSGEIQDNKKPEAALAIINKNKWNVFECEYDENNIKVYVNGSLVLEWDKAKNKGALPSSYALILSMQYGWKDSQIPKLDRATFPVYMDIAYVKHYVK